MIKTFCYFSNWSLDDYHARIYGIDYFQSLGFEVVVCNMTMLLNPHLKFREKPPELSVAHEIEIGSWRDLDVFLDGRSGLFGIALLTLEQKTVPFYRALRRFNVPYLNFYSTNIPAPSLKNKFLGVPSWRRDYWRAIFKAFLGRVWRYFSGHIPGLQPPRYLLRFGKRFTLNCPTPNAHTRLIDSHTIDFDLTLENQTNQICSESKTAIFLDEFLFGHTDFMMGGGSFPIRDANRYFSALRKLFDSIETSMGYRIIIAAHPRAPNPFKDIRFGKREIIQHQTAKLVRHSDFVLTHCSTSISFAVLFRKPIVFLNSDEIKNGPMGPLSTSFARAFGQLPINLDSFDKIPIPVPIVSELLYKEYEENYIKYPHSPRRSLWPMVRDEMVKDGLISPVL